MDQSTGTTLRERSKLDKRRRIEQAAREVFAERGFDKATTREIAKRAGVGVATLFVYAPDKAQLLKAIFESELDRISARGESIRTEDSLVAQLIQFFRPRYELWMLDPRLSRTAMVIGFASYIESANTDRDPPMVWAKAQDGIRDIMERNQQCGRFASDVNVESVSQAVFCIYMTHVHLWISQKNPKLEDGLSSLAALFEVVCKPLEAKS